jgi:hypothetical protein
MASLLYLFLWGHIGPNIFRYDFRMNIFFKILFSAIVNSLVMSAINFLGVVYIVNKSDIVTTVETPDAT